MNWIISMTLAFQLLMILPVAAVEEKHEGFRPPHTEAEEHGHHEKGHDEADENSSEGGSDNVGPDKAVLEADPKKGFRLSEAAAQRIGVKLAKVTSVPAKVPPQAIVRIKDEIGVYRVRDGWFKLVHGEVEGSVFRPEKEGDLRVDDQIAVSGIGLLRIAELDAFSSGEEGHGH